MVFNLTQNTNSKLEKFYSDAIKRLNEFYMFDWNENKPILFIVNNRKDIDIIREKKTEDWVVGFTLGSQRFLFVLDPEKYNEESSHTYSDDEYSTLISHELSHLYAHTLYNEFYPVWLLEGIAIASSGQLDTERYVKPKEFNSFLKYLYKGGSELYSEAGYAVQIMIDDCGREKFLNFYRDLTKVEEEKDLNKLFKEYYKEDLNYEYFNNRL
jgi:hypothetical protein